VFDFSFQLSAFQCVPLSFSVSAFDFEVSAFPIFALDLAAFKISGLDFDLFTADERAQNQEPLYGFDNRGKSHHSNAMPTLTLERPGRKQRLTVLENYDVAADAKKRISLRKATTKYFHVQALSNGCFYLEPRVLVSPQAISARSLKMLDKSVASLKKGLASAPIDLAALVEA
jgi:hypothetical protein